MIPFLSYRSVLSFLPSLCVSVYTSSISAFPLSLSVFVYLSLSACLSLAPLSFWVSVREGGEKEGEEKGGEEGKDGGRRKKES